MNRRRELSFMEVNRAKLVEMNRGSSTLVLMDQIQLVARKKNLPGKKSSITWEKQFKIMLTNAF